MSTHPIPVCPLCYAPQTDPDPEKNPHRQNCANRSKKDMLADIEWFKTGRIKARNDASIWQAKFHTLRLENNGLRRRLRKQAAPTPEPQWHNPDSMGDDIVKSGDGWRLILKEEFYLPENTQYYHWWNKKWVDTKDACRVGDVTYRTRTPLPK